MRKLPMSGLPRVVLTMIEIMAIALLALWLSVAVGSYWQFAAPFVICIFLSAFLQGKGLVSYFLKSKPIQILADLSFAIYMVHAIVLLFLLAFLHTIEPLSGGSLFAKAVNPMAGLPGATATIQVLHLESNALKWAIGALYVAIVLLLSLAIHRFVEKPGRSVFGRLAKRVSARPSIAPAAPPQPTLGAA